MPAAHGRSSAVFLNSYNVSAFLSSFDSTKTVDTAEVTTFGNTSKSYVTGLRDGTITLGGYFDGGAGALDEIMTMMLSDTQVSYGTDSVTGGDSASSYTVTNVVDAATPITGFTNSISFADNSVNRSASKSATTAIGRPYLISAIVQTNDNGEPFVTGTPAGSTDFVFQTNGSYSVTGHVKIDLGANRWLVGRLILPTSVGSTVIVQKFTNYLARGFRLSGLSLNEITTTPAPNPILSICEDGAGTIGNRCTVAQVIDTSYQITGSISDAVQVTAEFQADGTGVSGAYRGVVLAPLAAYSNGQNTTSFDGGAASSNGLVANLHVISAGGSATVKIQHSTDNSSWTDLITFTTGAVQFCEHKTTTGTVHRYLRVNVVTDGLPVMVVTAARK